MPLRVSQCGVVGGAASEKSLSAKGEVIQVLDFLKTRPREVPKTPV